MSHTHYRLGAGLVAALGLSAIAACSSDSITAAGSSAVTLSFATRTSSTASFAGIPITNNGHTLDITSATLNISKVELHSTKGETESECDDDHDCGPLASQPLVVTLSPTGALVTVNTTVVPAGTYREIEIKVGSVRLVGTYDGRAFDVVVPINVEREMEFQPPVTVGGADDPARNITIAVPFTTWFTNADGSLVDPARLATDATLRATVASRVHASFRAFRDDDHDSDDDDHEESHD
jgi:hypothetical protein